MVNFGDTGALKVKLRSLFRGSIARVFTRMSQSPDDILALEPPLASNISYAWLPNTHKKVEIDECDLVFCKATLHLALKAVNFAEIVLQAWDANLRDEHFQDKIKSCLSTIVMSFIQTQTSITFGCLQLRRDHYLAHMRGLSQNAIQQ